jgi:hypothetical protein
MSMNVVAEVVSIGDMIEDTADAEREAMRVQTASPQLRKPRIRPV